MVALPNEATPCVRRLDVAALACVGAAVLVAILNTVILGAVVGPSEDRGRIYGFGFAFVLGPAGVLAGILMARRWISAAFLILYAVASFITGFSVGFWNLLLGVPLCAAALALSLRSRAK